MLVYAGMQNITDASSFIWTLFPAVIFLYKKPMCPAMLAFHGLPSDSCMRIVKSPAVSKKKSQAHSCTKKCSLIKEGGRARRAELFYFEEVTQDRKSQDRGHEKENSSSQCGCSLYSAENQELSTNNIC